ncbi:molybdopterin molybdotransferase MoeA [Leucobacter allii]|uniref:molybdopterin molybdotransferase MoeA n=1 Tax=Leucobacter allii TaxID=2932247 RepID=UPI001FD0E872|nr:gephyrin-like molybdotransferase Glp [Leucobacter allii]UOR02743.1 molybdopterin molybdotransferase MoeA [Leucobacter allii]
MGGHGGAGGRGDGAGRVERVSAEAHLARVLAETPPLPAAEAPLREAGGRVLAEDARARNDLPLWDNSAMDGYALRAGDAAGASEAGPVRLRIVGEIAAGSAEDPPIPAGSAVRIMTGAPLPGDADAVVPVERTRGDAPPGPVAEPGAGDASIGRWAEEEVSLFGPVDAGANVRRRGEDARVGAVLARAGDRLGARRIAALAAAGVDVVRVRPAPRVAVIATGAELRAPGELLARGEIPESNSLLITALLAEQGLPAAEVRVGGDDVAALRARLAELGRRVDVVITTGGVGPGRHDVVRLALADEPGVRAVSVAVKPGQPQCTGRLRGGARIFALPGNPVSAAVSFELFVRPALLRMQGAEATDRMRLPAVAETGWRGAPGRLQVLPVRVRREPQGLVCRPAVEPRGVSHAVGGHGSANGYALVAPERGDVAAGEGVDVILLEA